MASTASSDHDDALQSKSSLTISELRSRVMIGPLPDDFLRLTQPQSSSDHLNVQEQVQQSEQVFMPMSPVEQYYTFVPPHTRGRIVIKIVEAKLTKNYGFVRMDPYVRVRVGNTIFETPTSVNGGKTPTWNRTINAYLPNDVESIYLQIFDERAFTNDECVAWAHIILPEGIFSNETIDEWYSLSGPQGEGKEGVVNLVMSFTPVDTPVQLPSIDQQQQAQIQQQIYESSVMQQQELFTEEELNELHVMFPSVDKEVIRSVLEEKRGNKDSAVTALIEMTN